MAQPNQLNPRLARVGLAAGGVGAGIYITGGTATDATSIILELGTPGTDLDYGSVYICSTTGTQFIAEPTGTWRKVTTA